MAERPPSKLFSVEGMVVLITGGGSGIGLMMTKAFALHGAHKVYIVGRRLEVLEDTVKLSPNIVPLVGDATSKQSLQQIAAHIERETGYLNVVCLNHGYMEPACVPDSSTLPVRDFAQQALASLDPEDWTRAFTVNYVSMALSIFAFLPLLDAGNQQRSHPMQQSQFIVTSSIAAFLRGPESRGAYGPSKAAVTQLVKSYAGLLVPYSVRVNAIAPGPFPSDMFNNMFAGGGGAGRVSKSFIPAERPGKTEDIIGTILYMAGEAGAYMNGSIHLLDGGRITQLKATY